jgi:hypothetical protein
MKVFNKIHKTYILSKLNKPNPIKKFSSKTINTIFNNKFNNDNNDNIYDNKYNNNFNKITKKFFSQDITNNQKLKKKFYNKSELIKLDIENYKNFLKINELYLEDEGEDNKNPKELLRNDNNIYRDKNENKNDLDNEINNNIIYDTLNSFTKKNLQKKLYNIKTKNLGFNYEKNFEKFNILFNGSLFHKEYYGILLDGRRCKSMHLDELKIPSKKLALAMALEWQSQKDLINFHKMHLYFHISNGIRISKDQIYRKNTVDKIISFFPTDQIFYCEDVFLEKIIKEENLCIDINEIIHKFKKNFDLDFDFPAKDNKGKNKSK